MSTTESIFGLYPDEIKSLLETSSEPAYRTRQLLDWIFTKRVRHLEAMSDLSKSYRGELQKIFDWKNPEIVSKLDAEDGATKLLLKSANKVGVYESVILRYDGRTSLCVSSQVGCKLSCSFCQTGKLGFFRNLSTSEIMAQFLIADEIVKQEGRSITHVVFMGMGEPLDNFDNAVKATNLLIDHYTLSARRVTLSTSGIVPKILELPEKTRASLAISLHACRDDLRSELMPINTKYPLAQLKDALATFQKKTGQLLTIEYILIKNKTCSLKEAKELVRFLHGLRAKVNLIPFNSHPGLSYEMPTPEDVRAFQEHLSKRGFPAPVRYSKGLAVSAACGQLAAKLPDQFQEKPLRSFVVNASHG